MTNLAGKPPLGLKQPKDKKDAKYLDKVRERPCCICQKFGMVQRSPTTAHHPIHDRYGTRKVGDRQAIPLCPLSMANSGEPDTGGSQIFINVRDNKHLDWWNGESESAHPVFGKITEGYDIVKKIEGVEISVEQPVNPIKIISVKIL